MDNSTNSHDNPFHDLIKDIIKIDRIVIVDDVRTITQEDMDEIRKKIVEDN